MQVDSSPNSCCSDQDPASNNRSVHREFFIIQGESPEHIYDPFHCYYMDPEVATTLSGLAATVNLAQSPISPIEETSYDDTRSELVVQLPSETRFIDYNVVVRRQATYQLNNTASKN